MFTSFDPLLLLLLLFSSIKQVQYCCQHYIFILSELWKNKITFNKIPGPGVLNITHLKTFVLSMPGEKITHLQSLWRAVLRLLNLSEWTTQDQNRHLFSSLWSNFWIHPLCHGVANGVTLKLHCTFSCSIF